MATFSKRHYEAIADKFFVVKMRVQRPSWALTSLQEELTKLFTTDNPRFDAERFNKACGGEL